MEPETPTREKPPFVVLAASGLIFTTMCFSLLPYALQAFHNQFLPSPKYLADVKYISLISGLACALPGAFLATTATTDPKKEGIRYRILVPLFCLLMLFIWGHQLVATIIPTLTATLSNSDVDITYVVKAPAATDERFCDTPVTLEYMPSYSDKLCDLPSELRQQLRPGSEIIVTGRGTSWGLFVRSARLANASLTEQP